MFTTNRLSLRRSALILACIPSMTACKTASEMRAPPLLEREAPEVPCRQPAAPSIPKEPDADQWLEWIPPAPGDATGAARLSRRAVEWIIDVLTVLRVSEGLRASEHDCLDALEAKGLIRQ